MRKCSVRMTRKVNAGSNSDAPPAAPAHSRTLKAAAALMSSRVSSRARNIFQKGEVGGWQDVKAGERAPGNGNVGLAPQADITGREVLE